MINIVNLSKVVKINPRPPKDIDETQEVTFLPMAAISENGYVAFEEKRILSEVKKGFTYFERGDFLIAKITPCFENGKAALTCNIENPIGYGSTEFHVIRPIPEKLDKSYLYYLLWSEAFRFYGKNKMRGAAGQKRVTTDLLKDYKIPLPPLKEQKRIAAILGKADAIRQKRQQAIDLTDQLLHSVFLDMFGDLGHNNKYKQTSFGDVAVDFQNGIGKNKEYYGSGSKVANIGDLYKYHTFEPKKYSLLDVTDKEISKYSLNRGDLLFVRSSLKREGVAFCSCYDSDELCLFSSFMIKCTIKPDIYIPKFLAYMLRLPSMRIQLINASNTATITNISQVGLSSIQLPLIPISDQKNFVEVLSRYESLKDDYLRSMDLENKLLKSLTYQSFLGELTKKTEAA